MTPGLAGGPPFPPLAKKGAIVAVASTDKPSVPVSVGTCLIDVSELGSVQGAKGHAVQTAHWAGDEIWSYGASGRPGKPPPEELPGWLSQEVDTDNLAQATADLKLEDEDEQGGVPLHEPSAPDHGRSQVMEAGKDLETTEEVLAQADVKEMTTKEIDEAFRNAFLYGIYHYTTTGRNEPMYGLSFPLNQSFVMSNLIQPFLPDFTPEQANALQIKKSSYKNIKKFIKSLDKEGLIRSKERDGHETTIADIDWEEPAFKNFKPYRLPMKETHGGTSLGRGEKATSNIDTGDSSVGQQLTIKQFYKPSSRHLPLFEGSNSPNSFFSASEIRAIVTRYVEFSGLVSETNKRLVKLNPFLANDLFDGSNHLDNEVQAKGSVPRDALVDRVMTACSSHYTISRSDEEHSKPRAGQPPKVQVVLETRSGNKTVTKVSGLEPFFIPPQPLADELRKTCAGSTAVEQMAGSSPRAPVMEVLVQGPQKEPVIKALERRGVRTMWIVVEDKTKGKKR